VTEVVQTDQASRPRPLRAILLLLALITSPLVCCGAIQLLEALPSSLLPSGLDFTLNLFEAEARVENRTTETLYLTPITTTYGEPRVIRQNISFRQRDIPLGPDGSVLLKYDSADMPLSGIAVCRTDEDCRLLAIDNSGVYVLESYESLPSLEPSWLMAIQSNPLNNYSNVLLTALSLLPILLFSSWLYLGRLEKKRAG
jgi:hypothetical protein